MCPLIAALILLLFKSRKNKIVKRERESGHEKMTKDDTTHREREKEGDSLPNERILE